MQTEISTENLKNPAESLKGFGVVVRESVTTPSRPGKKPRPVWIVAGDVFGLEEFFREIGGRKFRGQWSFFFDPSDDVLKQLQTEGRVSFKAEIESKIERKEARSERLADYAEKSEARAAAHASSAAAISAFIPMGQPILVGHHSERRHRRDLSRIDRKMRNSVEESKKSEDQAYRSRSLAYEAKKMRSSPTYISNRIKEAGKKVAAFEKWVAESPEGEAAERLKSRLTRAKEELGHWETQFRELNSARAAAGEFVPSPEVIEVGDLVDFHGWLPVVRVNKKTVTVSHWLGVPSMTYKLKYAKIRGVKRRS